MIFKFVRYNEKQNKPRKRGTIYAGTRIHSGIRKIHSKLVKHDKILSTMFNAQYRKIEVIPFPLYPTFFLLFLFICHALMFILLSVHWLPVPFSNTFCMIHIVIGNYLNISFILLSNPVPLYISIYCIMLVNSEIKYCLN